MSTPWLSQLSRLTWRSRPALALLISAAVISFLLAVASSISGALEPSSDQRLRAEFGTSDLVITAEAWDGAPPGHALPDLPLPDLGRTVEHWTVWSATPALRIDGTSKRVDYREGTWPSPASDDVFELRSGRWPSAVGECAVAGGTNIAPTVGDWQITATGTLTPTALRNTTAALCFPGTWSQWALSAELKPLIAETARAKVYVVGAEPDLVSIRDSADGATGTEVTYRADSMRNRIGPVDFLRKLLPWLMLPFFAMAAVGSVFGRWVGGTAHVVRLIGGGWSRFRRRAILQATVAAVAVTFISARLAVGLTALALPLLQAHVRLESTDPKVSPLTSLVLSVTAGAGAALGARIGAHRARDRRTGPSEPAGHTAPARVAPPFVAAAIAAGAWACLLAFGTSSLWFLTLATIALALSGALAAVGALRVVAWRMSRTSPTPFLLARRLLQDHDKSALVGLLAGLLGITMSGLALTTANGTILVKLAQSIAPAGFAVIGNQTQLGDDVPAEIIAAFRTDIGAGADPVSVYETIVHETDGYLWNFASLSDAQRILGVLTQEQQAVLLDGGALLQAPEGAMLTVAETDEPIELTTMPFTGPTDRVFRVAGFTLESALPEAARHTRDQMTWYVFDNLTPEADEVADGWLKNTGFSNLYVYAAHPATAQLVQSAVAAMFLGIGIGIALATGHALRGEARQLESLVAGLRATGVSKSWTRHVLLYLAFIIGGIPVLAGVTATLAVLGGSHLTFPDAFSLSGTSWAIVCGVGLVTLAGSVLGALAIRGRVRYEQRLNT
ncbi:MAG: hypothetical protein QM713_04085 [Arachnia sp.]